MKPDLNKIEIPLTTKPRPYRRGDGPSMAPLSLALENDSTAFIADKFVRFLPDRPYKQQMHYLVRWSDLPAAALAVPATEILDYVSSRALEDYEYQLSLEEDQLLEQQQQQQEQDKTRLKRPRDRPARPQNLASPESQAKPASLARKRGRPRRASFQPSRSLLAPGHVAAADIPAPSTPAPAPSMATTPKRGAKPSLSTPQKAFAPGAYADDLAEEFTDEEVDLDEALTQQLSRKNEYDVGADDTTMPSSGFTPVGRAVGQWGPRKHSRSPEPESDRERETIAVSMPPPDSNPNSQRKKRRKLSKPEPKLEPAWEVKRLEGHMITDVGGQPVRFFKVRWEGDWPPSENPTWEPQENLPPGLVKQYLKKKARKEGAEIELVSPLPIPPRPPRKYSSVAEAFEGEIEESQHQLAADVAESDHDERLLVEEDHFGF
ncbi:hypothetical protein PG991_004272 [Apiospora marii]|uniref:Chromo domain-containing protein n=2 Tax=Apiospora marii TaxID=335849 RepID=A0ABR1S610_9PEZI